MFIRRSISSDDGYAEINGRSRPPREINSSSAVKRIRCDKKKKEKFKRFEAYSVPYSVSFLRPGLHTPDSLCRLRARSYWGKELHPRATCGIRDRCAACFLNFFPAEKKNKSYKRKHPTTNGHNTVYIVPDRYLRALQTCPRTVCTHVYV